MTDSALDDRFSGVLAPDTVLPSQLSGALRRYADLSGERRLMVAVLEDALHCYQKYVGAEDPKHQELFLDAEEWITTDNPTWFFSFANVCTTLDLDPDYVRGGLLKWRDARRTAGDASRRDEEASEEEPLRQASGE